MTGDHAALDVQAEMVYMVWPDVRLEAPRSGVLPSPESKFGHHPSMD